MMQQYISSPKRTSEILSQYGIRLRKGLGQNYMIDTNSIKKMVSLAGIKKGETVLEIGSGIGSLTEILLEAGAGKVICIEIDKKVSEAFRELFNDQINQGNIELIITDAMNMDYRELCGKYSIKKMVSNLPYKVAAPLMLKILLETPVMEQFWATIQKDIADRMLAKKGDKNYSSYTLKSNLLAEYKSCFKVSRNCFIPRPFVDSVVLEGRRKNLPKDFENQDIRDFFDLVNISFLHRRKKLLNSISLNAKYGAILDKIKDLLQELGKDPRVRAEDLTLEDFIYIYNNIN
jgi:16S rRNA (adenine1518-N6/adenine1519-N6)-dimethyltransferase